MTFSALLLTEADGGLDASVAELDDAQLPEGDVTVDVDWSSLNYKDGMIIRGIGCLVRTYPHVPGIDLAGTVAASSSPGVAVIVAKSVAGKSEIAPGENVARNSMPPCQA